MLHDGWRAIRRFLREARRRRVYTAVAAYGAMSVILIQIGHAVFVDALLLPEWSPRLLTVLLILGFPVVLVLAWVFDIGPDGVRRTESAEPASAGPAAPVPPAGATAAPPSAPGQARTGDRTAAARFVDRTAAHPAPWTDRAAGAGTAGHSPGQTSESPPEPPRETAEAPDPERVGRATLAHMRHELRTPINAIIGYSELLLEDAGDTADSEAVADLERIQEGGKELLALVDSILSPDHAAAEADADIESYGARIRADLRTPVTSVIGYAELLLEAGHTEMSADLERILAAARRLLELSSDIVQVATQPEGSGPHAPASLDDVTRLTRDVLSKIRPIRSGDPEPEDRQGTLLVVDDNAMNRDLLARQLARKGYLVSTAANGREALDRLRTEDFDLVLLDIIMPEIDGLEVLRSMKADDRLREVPVVMISSLDEIDGAIRCMEIGAADYLTKPFHPTLLDARIGAVLDVRRLRQREARHRAQVEEADALTFRLALGACPPSVAARIRAGDTTIRDHYPETTIVWCDLDHLLEAAPRLEPADRVRLMERAFACIEDLARGNGLETVLLHGSAVLIAAGAPEPDADHAARAAATAFDALATLSGAGTPTDPAAHVPAGGTPPGAPLRFGMHTGPAFGAVLNADRLAFQMWGEAVDLARRLELHAEPGSILASPAAHTALRDRFTFTRRGVIEVTGRGQMQTYVLAGYTAAPAGG